MVDNRDRFVYDNGYGFTTDIYLLPHGTSFFVKNGAWRGKIMVMSGVKYLYIEETAELHPLDSESDYGLSIMSIYIERKTMSNNQNTFFFKALVLETDEDDSVWYEISHSKAQSIDVFAPNQTEAKNKIRDVLGDPGPGLHWSIKFNSIEEV